MSNPLVVVIITTYNRANLIGEAIESVLNQSYNNFSILIVDDGSTDNTSVICDNYMEMHPRKITYYFKNNGGCASARNFGLNHLDENVRYVCFLDSDDRFLPDKLKNEVELLEETPEACFCYSSSIIYSEEKKVETLQKVAAEGHPEGFATEHFMTNNAKSNAIMYKKTILADKRFDESLVLNEDSEFLQRIAIEYKGVYSPVPNCWVRDHLSSKSRNKLEISKSILQANQKILNTYPDFYSSHQTQAIKRISQARKDVFVELMIAKHWREAGTYAQNSGEKVLADLKLGVYYKIRRLLWRKFISKFKILKRIAGR